MRGARWSHCPAAQLRGCSGSARGALVGHHERPGLADAGDRLHALVVVGAILRTAPAPTRSRVAAREHHRAHRGRVEVAAALGRERAQLNAWLGLGLGLGLGLALGLGLGLGLGLALTASPNR